MDDVPQLDVMAVGAHPDDVEITCGGTLAALVRQGYQVGIVDLTDGEPTPNCPHPDVRRAEARAAADTLGITHRVILDLPNRRLMDSIESRVALATQIRRFRPRIVIGFGDRTPMASPDHWQARQITDAAVFYSRLTKWDEYFANLPVHQVERQLYFCIPFEKSLAAPANHFVIDISQTLQAKLDAIRCYRTQFEHKEYIARRVESSAVITGMTAGFDAGEAFVGTAAVGARDMVKMLLDGQPR